MLDLACEKHNNPADFYLDKIIKSEEVVKDAQSAVTDEAKGINLLCIIYVVCVYVVCVCARTYVCVHCVVSVLHSTYISCSGI